MAERQTKFVLPEDFKGKVNKSQSEKSLQATTSSLFDIFHDEEEKPDFNNPANRSNFISIVFSIVTVQLIFTIVCTMPFIMKEETKKIVFENTWLIWMFLVILIVPYFMLACCETTRKEFPTTIILLFFLTLGMAGTCACCTVWFETVVILYTFVLTAVVTTSIAILACAAQSDFTTWKWIIGIMAFFLAVFVIVAVVIATTTTYQFSTFLYPGILVSIFSAFLLHDINYIMGGHRIHNVATNDYLLGSAQIYVDIVGVFVTVLEIIGTITDTD